jgi:large subunit ribosomal protein L22
MSQLKYAMQGYDEKKMAKARLNNAPLSRKVATEISNMIRYKSTKKAKMLLEEVIDMKRAVPYKKFNRSVAHKVGIGPGRYPVKAVQEILTLIKLAESNASNKGLGENLVIKHLAANKGNMQWHHGRQSRRQVKSTHVEIVICEKEEKKSKDSSKAEEKKAKKVAEHKEERMPSEEKTEETQPKAKKTQTKKAKTNKNEAKKE